METKARAGLHIGRLVRSTTTGPEGWVGCLRAPYKPSQLCGVAWSRVVAVLGAVVWFGCVHSIVWCAMLHCMVWCVAPCGRVCGTTRCVAPYSDPPTATAARVRVAALLPGHEAFFWELSAAYMHNGASISPRRGTKDQKWEEGTNKRWQLPLPKWRKTISGTLSTGSETENNVCMIKHDLTVNRRWDDPIWEEAGSSK